MTPPLRCITIRQPWAGLIAAGIKTVENRSRRVNYRGLVGVHAGLAIDRAACDDPVVQDALAHSPLAAAATSVKGAIIAVVDLTDCHPAAAEYEPYPPCGVSGWCCRPWGQLAAWHLVLANVRRIDPIATKGAQSLPWFAPPEVADLVWGQLTFSFPSQP